MHTLVLDEPGRFSLIDTSEPATPGQGEALIRVRCIGVCGTDIHAFRGEQPYFSYPRILGHELGAEVVAVGGGVTNVKPGDRCAVEPYMTCGDCPPCRAGKTNCCQQLKCLGVQTDGGMRERIIVPADKLHQSDKLDFDTLALVETLGIGKHAVDRAAPSKGDRVAVIGLGPIGLTVATFAKVAGADVIGIDLSEARTQSARDLLGIKTMLLDTGAPIEAQWADTFGDPPLIVFDATGNRASMQQAFKLPVSGGRLVFVGLVLGEIVFDDPEFHRRELTLLSSRNSTGQDFRQIIELIEAGRVDVTKWITHRSGLADWPGVFDDWLAPGSGLIKGVVLL